MNIEALFSIFSAFGLSASAGLNAYIPLLTISLLSKFTNAITLTDPYTTLESWWIIGTLIFLSLIEFFVDKIPFVQHINNFVQTLIRPAAGAVAFAAATNVVTEINPIFTLAAGLLIAGSVHTTKSVVVRPMLSLVSGGTASAPASFAEDVISVVISFLAIVIPWIIAVFIIILSTTLIWLRWRKFNRNNLNESE